MNEAISSGELKIPPALRILSRQQTVAMPVKGEEALCFPSSIAL